MAALGSDQPNELVISSVVRASFCEGLLHDMGLGDLAQDGFFLGLFSTIDEFLGRPLPEAVDRLPVSEEVRTALLGGANVLRRVYDVVLAWERGAWDEMSLAAAGSGCGARRSRRATRTPWSSATRLPWSKAGARLASRAGDPRRARSRSYAPAVRAATIGGSSSTSCTFRVSASAVKGFWRKAASALATPCRSTVSSVYPDM